MRHITRLALAVTLALALALTAMTAAAALAAPAAQAAEGPYYTVESVRLEGKTPAKIEGKLAKAYVLTAGTIKVTCEKLKLETATVAGSTGANGATGEQTISFESCNVTGNGEKCEVTGKKITTKALKTTLAFTNKESKTGEVMLMHFAPVAGGSLAVLTFTGTCTTKETMLEGSVDGEVWASAKALKVAEEPLDGTTREVNFPATAIKTSFIEEEKARKEVKPALTAFGKAATLEGRTEMTLTSKEGWNMAAAMPPPPHIETVDFIKANNILIDHRNDADHTKLAKLKEELLPAPEQPLEIKQWNALDEIEWRSPKLGEVTTNWPIAYKRESTIELNVRFGVSAATRAFLQKQLEGNPVVTGKTTINGVAITFTTTIEKVAEQLEKHETYLEGAKVKASVALNGEVRYALATITWKWEAKEKGRAATIEQQVGKSTHNLYTTFKEATGSVYLTLLDAATQNIEKETQPPSEAQTLSGVWKAFSNVEAEVPTMRIRIYNPASGEINRAGAILWYYQQITPGLNLKQVIELDPPTACGVNVVVGLLEWATGECGAWQKTMNATLAYEGLTAKNIIVRVKFATACEIVEECVMLVSNWKFEGEGTSKNAEFPYKETEVVDQNGLSGQGVKNPASAFGNHQVIEAEKKLYDPSYGSEPLGTGAEGPLGEGAEGKDIRLKYQEKAISGFCKFAAVPKEWQCQKAVKGTLKLVFE